ncbi:MAG: cold shock domain-containing protein [Gemmatimonadales bacterium]|nr:MAG: cold shock domain-containing protein [Gemmatimonadales bacterium]
MTKQQGTVKWFSRDKGWGFVRLDGGEEIFVHHTDIQGDGRKTLEDDERVEFSIEQLDKGPRARNVTRLDSAVTSTGKSEREGRANRRGGSRSSGGSRRTTTMERAPKHPNEQPETVNQPGSLAQQLRNRLTRLFPGIGA